MKEKNGTLEGGDTFLADMTKQYVPKERDKYDLT